MRSTLSFNPCYSNMPGIAYQNMQANSDDIERLYPDIYRIIYPMVTVSCNTININMAITEELIDNMTNEIYDKVEADPRIEIQININSEVQNDRNNRQTSDSSMQRRPRPRNRFLRDLIRILLLRELLGRRSRTPFRPF